MNKLNNVETMGLLKEFKTFALKGNVIDMAVGVIIGGAFNKIVTSLVNDIIMPPLGALLGDKNFADFAVTIKAAKAEVLNDAGEVIQAASPEVLWKYGSFIQVCIDFLIIAMSVFVMIKVVNKLSSLRKKEEEKKKDPEPTKEEVLLTEIRDLLKEKM